MSAQHSSQPNLQSTDAREDALLAPWALHSKDSTGRKHPEPPHLYRGPFQRDRDRIVHSTAYRRLSYKTQVFTGDMGDYHRTRLTHTLEVSSVARTLARALRLNEDLVEALALAHDIGHPPFGHTGEDTLDACLSGEGGFNHNRHALRIVEQLETRYRDFPGLNLSREVLEGQEARVDKAGAARRPLLEAQVVEAADSVAYDTHDADDALELGLLELEELLDLALWREAAGRVRARYADLNADELRRAVLHELIDWQVGDLLEQASERLSAEQINSPEAVRRAATVVRPNESLAEKKIELERFLYRRVYRHPRVLAMRTRATEALDQMFEKLTKHPELLPESYRARIERIGVARSTGDYLAGMTDRYAIARHEELFGRGE